MSALNRRLVPPRLRDGSPTFKHGENSTEPAAPRHTSPGLSASTLGRCKHTAMGETSAARSERLARTRSRPSLSRTCDHRTVQSRGLLVRLPRAGEGARIGFPLPAMRPPAVSVEAMESARLREVSGAQGISPISLPSRRSANNRNGCQGKPGPRSSPAGGKAYLVPRLPPSCLSRIRLTRTSSSKILVDDTKADARTKFL